MTKANYLCVNPGCPTVVDKPGQYCGYHQRYRAEAAEARVVELEQRVKQLEAERDYLRSTDHAADLAFERAAPLDWRGYESDETPIGQALDGQGDEVE